MHPIDINPACPRVICPKQPTVIFKLAAKITFIKINIIIPIWYLLMNPEFIKEKRIKYRTNKIA